jgi:Protein of unknown function (DUF2380)
MKTMFAVLALAGALFSAGLAHAGTKAAVFDLEFIDTSLEATTGVKPEETARLAHAGAQLRARLAESGQYDIVDVAPQAQAARAANLQNCGGCDAAMAKALGAKLSFTGTVQKVSNLILNVNVYVRDAESGKALGAMSVDMRGNTDESWTRALDHLVKNQLIPAKFGEER